MELLKQTFVSFMASLGFGVIFNIKGKKLIFASLGGGLSWMFYLLFLRTFNLGGILSLFLSTLIFSIYCEIGARILKTPVTTLIICALIPLVPGAGMYYTMYETIIGNVNSAIELGLKTLAEAGTLALGVIFVSTITRQVVTLKRAKEKPSKK